MLKAIILVAAAAAAQNATINLFTAVDKPAYLAELAASMRHAYELEPRRRRGRRYRWFILYAAPLDGATVCASADAAHRFRPKAWAEWDGCAEVAWAPARSCELGVPAQKLRTVNVLRLTEGTVPPVLREIYERTKRVFEIAGQCHSRSGLVNYMNLAPRAARVQTPSRRRRGAHGHRTGTPSTRFSCPSA